MQYTLPVGTIILTPSGNPIKGDKIAFTYHTMPFNWSVTVVMVGVREAQPSTGGGYIRFRELSNNKWELTSWELDSL